MHALDRFAFVSHDHGEMDVLMGRKGTVSNPPALSAMLPHVRFRRRGWAPS